MKAVRWHGKNDIRVDTVPDPEIVNPRDAIVRVTSTAICGSDLHLFGGHHPAMKKGDILGHEFMGEIVDTGAAIKDLHPGDRVVVSFNISCGNCHFCKHQMTALCDNSNPNTWKAEAVYSTTGSGVFGYSHMLGGYSGGQAEYVRVPYADVGCLKIDSDIDDERVLFLSDIFPSGYMAAEQCDIERGDIVAVWGCGAVGQFAIRSALMLGAERVVAIDRFAERLDMAARGGAETLHYEDDDVLGSLRDMSAGRGPDACIVAAGMETHGTGVPGTYKRIKQALGMPGERVATALRQAVMACRKGGVVSTLGVYGSTVEAFPLGVALAKALTLKMGQTHTHRYMRPLLRRIEQGDIDPSFVITHRLGLDDAPFAYEMFARKWDRCVKVVMHPS